MPGGRLYRNAGAAFTSTDGKRIERGQIFTPTPTDLARRRYKLHAVAGPGVRSVPVPAPEPEAPPAPALPIYVGFPRVDFASDRAYEVARDVGLTDVDLPPGRGSGFDGAYTVADVRGVIAARTQPTDDTPDAP